MAYLVGGLLVAATALAAPPAPKPASLPGLAVVDSAGKTVGKFVPSSSFSGVGVLLTVGAATYGVRLMPAPDRAKLTYETFNRLYFVSSNCTGPGYAWIGGLVGVPQAVTMPDASGRIWLYPVSGTSSGAVMFNSWFGSVNGDVPTCITSLEEQVAFPVTATPIEITNLFSLPFTLQ
jgi:hypothetical protein